MADHSTLTELDGTSPFAERHIGLRDADVAAMLDRLGFDSLGALMAAAVPGGIRTSAELDLPAPLSEEATARELFVHPNTVRYRLKRVSDVIGWDATGPREALILQTALIIGSSSRMNPIDSVLMNIRALAS